MKNKNGFNYLLIFIILSFLHCSLTPPNQNRSISKNKTQNKTDNKTPASQKESIEEKSYVNDTDHRNVNVLIHSGNGSFALNFPNGVKVAGNSFDVTDLIVKKSSQSKTSTSVEFYSLQIGAFSSESNAENAKKEYNQSSDFFVRKEGKYFKAFLGKFESLKDAKKFQAKYFKKKSTLIKKISDSVESQASGNAGLYFAKGDLFQAFDNSIILEPEKGYFIFNKNKYKGRVKVYLWQGRFYLVNELDLEDYLKGVVPNEMPTRNKKNYEAVKAQAVISRTYVYHKMLQRSNKFFDVRADENSQVYRGLSSERDISNKAIDETASVFILYKGKPIEAVFHSTCGGGTKNSKDVWGSQYPYLQGIKCSDCRKSPYYDWKNKGSFSSLAKYLNVNRVSSIKVSRKNDIVKEVYVYTNKGKKTVSDSKFRQIMSSLGVTVYSSNYEVVNRGSAFEVKGHGSGHGVGMCQYGAMEKSSKGMSYQAIIKAYYKGVEIKSLKI